jgi:methionyl-tRNA synthetase
MLAEPLSDLCITRPRARLDWGIEVPFDRKYVTWVWFDAFWAYMSVPAVERSDFLKEAWPTSEHFIGKDILKTHAVYWPAMLMSAELPLYRRLNVHGWVNFGGQRMSKSSGNVASPADYQETFGPDGLRYFVLREVVYGLDGDFTNERMIERYNADLANDLGNLVSRSLSMAAKYFGGQLTAAPGAGSDPIDMAFVANFQSVNERVEKAVEALAFNRALELLWELLDKANKYVVQTSPFSLAKDPAKLPRVAQILANLLEGLRITGDNLEPFMPVSSARILDLLNCDAAIASAPFGEGLTSGHSVKPPVPLFPRIEKK